MRAIRPQTLEAPVLIDMSAMPRLEVLQTIVELLDMGAIRFTD